MLTWFLAEELWSLHLQDHVAGAGKLAHGPRPAHAVLVTFHVTMGVFVHTCTVNGCAHDAGVDLNHWNRGRMARKA